MKKTLGILILIIFIVGLVMAAGDYQSTDKLSQDTNPQTPRVLLEGTVVATSADYTLTSGKYQARLDIDISGLNDLGNRVKGFNPETLDADVYLLTKVTPGGQIDDYFFKLPHVNYDIATDSIVDYTYAFLQNQYIIADDVSASYLVIVDIQTGLPNEQSFAYKIYSTSFQLEDVNL